MREIKFRAWNGHKMVNLYNITRLALHPEIKTDGIFIPFTDEYQIMQYTGLKDRNGVEIYEGDILLLKGLYREGSPRYNAIVIVKFEYSGWYICSIPKAVNYVSNILNDFAWEGVVEKAEVIGNIFENPELLENNQ